MMAKFTFINHASYVIETDQSVLLVDPWVEGYAFDLPPERSLTLM